MALRWLGWLAKVLLYGAAAISLLVALLLALLQVPALRDWAGQRGLLVLRELTGYRLEIERLDRLDPWGLKARRLRLKDPDGVELAQLDSLSVDLRPLALVHGELRLSHVAARGMRGVLPESLWSSTGEPEPTPPEKPAAEESSFEVRVDDVLIQDVAAQLTYDGSTYQIDLKTLQGAGRWGAVPAVTLGGLDLMVFDLPHGRARGSAGSHRHERRELLALRTERGRWDAAQGGLVALRGALAGAPLVVRAHFGPISIDGEHWPEGDLEVELNELQRKTLQILGVADGAGLLGKQDVQVHVNSHAQKVRATVKTARARLMVQGLLDEAHAEVAVHSAPLALDGVSDLLPKLRVAGTVRASYEFTKPHATIAAEWNGVALDGQTIPDATLHAEQLGSVIALRDLKLAGFERALRLAGSVDTATGEVDAELHLKDFNFDRIPYLKSQGVCGLSNADLALHLGGRDGFSGQGFLDIENARYAGARSSRVQLALGLYGELTAPRGQAELLVQNLKAGRIALHRLSADFKGNAQAVEARLLAHGPDSAFNAFLSGSRPTSDSYELAGVGRGRFAGQPVNFKLRTFAEAETGAYVGDLWLASRQQRVRGHAEVDRKGRFESTLDTQSLELETWSRMAGVEGVRGHVESFTHVAGTMERPLINVKLTGGAIYAQNEGPFDVMLNLETDLGSGKLYSDMEVTSTADKTRLNANVRSTFPASDLSNLTRVLDQATYELTVRAQLPVERFARFAGPRMEALRGTIDASIDAHGNLDDPHAELSLQAKLGLPADSDEPAEVLHAHAMANSEQAEFEFALSDTEGPLLSAKGQTAWPGGALRKAVENPGSVATNLPKFQLRGYLAERRLDMMQGAVAYLAGVYELAMPVKARAELDLHGEGQRLDGTARAQILVFGDKLDPNCAIGSQSRLDLDAQLAENKLELKLLAYTQDGGKVESTVSTRLGKQAGEAGRDQAQDLIGELKITAQGKQIALSKLPGMCDLSSGKADFFLEARALGHKPLGATLQLNVEDLRTVTSDALAFKVRTVLDDRAATAKGELRIQGKHAGSIDVSVPLAYEQANDGAGAAREQKIVPSLAMKEPLKARVQFQELPLAPFLAIGEKLGRARGHASADLTVEGNLERPRAKGYIEVKKASFAISALAQPFHGVDARVEIDDHRVSLKSLSAKDLGGTLKIAGSADFKDDMSAKAKISIQAEKFPIRRQGAVIGELTTNAQIEGDLTKDLQTDVRVNVSSGRMWLTGDRGRDVQSLDANETVHFIDAPREEVEAVSANDDSGGLVLRSLKLKSEREIWLMHKDFSVQLGFDIRLTEDDGPKIEGEARLKRGDLMILGKSFTLQKGAIRFTGDSPPDPELDLRAVYKPSAGEDLIVQVTGRASAPGLTFSGAATDAGGAVMVLSGRANAGAEQQAQADAAGFAASVTAGLLSVTARRELGDWVPMLRVETDASGTPSRAAAGFDASRLIPPFLGGIAKGAYVEGIVGNTQNNNASRGSSVGLGVRLELSFPRDLVTTLGYGPGPNWSTDIAWAP